MRVAIYDPSTTLVQRVVYCPDEHLELQPWYDNSHYIVLDGTERTIPNRTRVIDGVLETPPISAEETSDKNWQLFRGVRNQKLTNCDWTQANDSPLTVQQRAAWAEYRRLLRSLPERTTDPLDPPWPIPPA